MTDRIEMNGTRLLVHNEAHTDRSRPTALLESTLSEGRLSGRWLAARDPVAEIRLDADCCHFVTSRQRAQIDPDRWLDVLSDQVELNHLTAVGWIGYEAMLRFIGVDSFRSDDELPRAHFYLYESPQWQTGIRPSHHRSADPDGALLESPEREWYLRACQSLLGHIFEGDIYQANLTARFVARAQKPPELVYERLRATNPAPYAAFLRFPGYDILSSSPELFLHMQDDQVVSRPIKGTIRADADEQRNEQNKLLLRTSPKERAELLMITDLIRHDLGQIALPGTVQATLPFEIESYRNLHHQVATIRCRKRRETTLAELLCAVCPGGSITGTPKKRAVELLQCHELCARSVYTGAIGFCSPSETMFNIAIRTIVHTEGAYTFHAGGGIVADSKPEQEWEELLLKAAPLLEAIGCHSS